MLLISGIRAAASLIEETSIRRSLAVCAIGSLSEWHLGEIASCQANMDEAISLAKELKDMHALAVALHFAAYLAHYERNPTKVERLVSIGSN